VHHGILIFRKATVVIVAGDNVDESRRPRTDADLPPGSSIGEWFWLVLGNPT
jgi:hypothetical protein